jgi:RNA polymerase sigma-70 factor (ECF subfamily)
MVLMKEPELAAGEPVRPEPSSDKGTCSFAAVVQEHWPAVYRLLYSMTGKTHDTEDLTQETFLRALKRLDTFQPGTRMRAWLLRIAANVFFDTQRRRKRASFHPLEHEVADPLHGPEHRLEVAEQSELLQAALKELTELTRMVFHLRAVEDLSFREIAELAGTTEQAARWHMHQARTKLLQRFAEKP